MKNAILLIAVLWLIYFWYNHSPHSSHGSTNSAAVVIDYTWPSELIAKLRKVKTGQKAELHFIPGPPISSGIRCSDEKAKAAYMEQMRQQAEEETRLINAELKRINGS